ncbi:MAG: DNA-formamidopyrimidine glycosylase family protein [Bacillota bacterium]
MAELPELRILSRQMDHELAGRRVEQVLVNQEKCLNLPVEEFAGRLSGRTLAAATSYGKWLRLALEDGQVLLINPGMGADIRYHGPGQDWPEKYQFGVTLDGGAGFSVRFWWFGHVHLLAQEERASHKPTAGLGPDALSPEVTREWLAGLLRKGSRSAIKNVMLDQRRIAGIGNAYAHDVFFEARVHPLRVAGSLNEEEISRLYTAMVRVLERAIELGGVERDFYGKGGNEDSWGDLMIIGYKEGKPCPACGSSIEKIRTGSTSGFICPSCQPAAG